MKKTILSLLLGIAMIALPGMGATIDVIVVVDESGSMSGEHAWLPGMISALDSQLAALGYTMNYGLIGYGNGLGGGQNQGRMLLNGGSSADFALAADDLVISGGTEDGYGGLNYAFNNFTFTPGGLRNYILVTDEDRDNADNSLSYASILAGLDRQNALLNAVLDNPFTCAGGSALGRTNSSGYQGDGNGGFTTCTAPVTGNGFGTTETDYTAMALATGGAAWNLNVLRSGGTNAASFTSAFVDIKVQEIQEQTAPEPSTYALGGSALALFAFMRYRQAKK